MNILLIALLLAALPIVNWSIIYYFTKRDNQFKQFKKHFTCYYSDWMLVPFNFFAAFAISINPLYLAVFIGPALIVDVLFYPHWAKVFRRDKNPAFFFYYKTNRISRAGIVHLIFQIAETSILFSFLISAVNNLASYLASASLLAFLSLLWIGSKKIHGYVLWTDAIFVVFGVIFTVLKVALSLQ